MITENLFEARFRTVQELARLGADTQVDGHHVMTHGVPILSGAPVESSDIRSGAALVIAGLVAEGDTLVSGVHHIDRGYPRFEEALRTLGAEVVREPDDEFRLHQPSSTVRQPAHRPPTASSAERVGAFVRFVGSAATPPRAGTTVFVSRTYFLDQFLTPRSNVLVG